MTDELSPEEKLLRLIKGDKKKQPGANPAADDARQSTASPEPDKQLHETKQTGGTPTPASGAKDETRHDTGAQPVRHTEGADKKILAEPILIIPDKSAAKPVPEKVGSERSVSPPNRKPAPAPEPKPVPHPVDIPAQPVAAATAPAMPDEPAAAPAAAQETPVELLHEGGFAGFMLWLMSGFTFINWLLILLLIGSVGATAWHLNMLATQRSSVPIDAQPTDVPEIPVEKEKVTDSGMQFVPQPFPYYMEMISSKNLFRLVEPPPPPAPPKAEVEAPKEPEIKIDTLTRNLVLQGIVYDIDPPQAIIFDKKENKTLFLGNGQMVTDQVKLKEIQRGKVILEFKDQTQELTF